MFSVSLCEDIYEYKSPCGGVLHTQGICSIELLLLLVLLSADNSGVRSRHVGYRQLGCH